MVVDLGHRARGRRIHEGSQTGSVHDQAASADHQPSTSTSAAQQLRLVPATLAGQVIKCLSTFFYTSNIALQLVEHADLVKAFAMLGVMQRCTVRRPSSSS